MSTLLEELKRLGPALIDPWYVVDAADRIVDFNGAFHALFPRAVARKLTGMGCRDTVGLPPCQSGECLRERCASGPLRLDELEAEVAGERLRFIISAAEVTLADGRPGALVILRNVTDDARVQARYQKMMEEAQAERVQLAAELDARTRELIAANEELNRIEEKLARAKLSGDPDGD